jgi:hypothetical protein
MAPGLRSDPNNETLLCRSPAPQQLGPDGHSVPLDVEAETERLSALRRQHVATAEVADSYVELGMQLGRRGDKGFDAMMDNLRTALEIREMLFDPHDPLLGRTYRLLYDMSIAKVPLEASIGWLKKSIEIAEHNLANGMRSQLWTRYYMNESYKQLARWYRVAGQTDLASETAQKIR